MQELVEARRRLPVAGEASRAATGSGRERSGSAPPPAWRRPAGLWSTRCRQASAIMSIGCVDFGGEGLHRERRPARQPAFRTMRCHWQRPMRLSSAVESQTPTRRKPGASRGAAVLGLPSASNQPAAAHRPARLIAARGVAGEVRQCARNNRAPHRRRSACAIALPLRTGDAARSARPARRCRCGRSGRRRGPQRRRNRARPRATRRRGRRRASRRSRCRRRTCARPGRPRSPTAATGAARRLGGGAQMARRAKPCAANTSTRPAAGPAPPSSTRDVVSRARPARRARPAAARPCPIPPVQGTSTNAQAQSSKRRSFPGSDPAARRCHRGRGRHWAAGRDRRSGRTDRPAPKARRAGSCRTSAQSSGDTAMSLQPPAIGQPSRPSRIIQVGSCGGPGGGLRNGAVLIMPSTPSRRDRW